MALLDAFIFEPFSVNESLLDSLLLEPDQFEFWISSSAGSGGSGTECDPYQGGTQTVLDSLMSSFPPNTTVHLGPGMFVTNGNNGGWAPKSGQRIVGAGFDDTILKLINASSSANLTSAIGAPLIGSSAPSFLNGFEVSDLTLGLQSGRPGQHNRRLRGHCRQRFPHLHPPCSGNQFWHPGPRGERRGHPDWQRGPLNSGSL